jgi:hypothetical protein
VFAGAESDHMRERFNPTEYSVIAKLRGTPPKPWRWEIYCAGRIGPVERGRVFFDSRAAALNEGKKALARLIEKESVRLAEQLQNIANSSSVPIPACCDEKT